MRLNLNFLHKKISRIACQSNSKSSIILVSTFLSANFGIKSDLTGHLKAINSKWNFSDYLYKLL